MKEKELKPCPFCGNTDLEMLVKLASYYRGNTLAFQNPNQNIYKVTCHCGVSGKWEYEKEKAIAKWNTRTAPPLTDKEKIIEILKKYKNGYSFGIRKITQEKFYNDIADDILILFTTTPLTDEKYNK